MSRSGESPGGAPKSLSATLTPSRYAAASRSPARAGPRAATLTSPTPNARAAASAERAVAPADEVGRIADALAIRGEERGDGHADRDDRVAALLDLPAQLGDEIGDRGERLVVVAYPCGPALERGQVSFAIHDPGQELCPAEIGADRDVLSDHRDEPYQS